MHLSLLNLHAGIMFRHILLNLIICCLSLCRCYIHIIKFNCDINIIIRLLFQLGQKSNCLNMRRKLFLILNSEIIAFCEKIYAPFIGVNFYPGNSIIKIIVLPTSFHKHLSLITLYSYHTNSGIYYS